MPHLAAIRRVIIIAEAPLVNTHLGTQQVHAMGQTLVQRLTRAVLVNRYRRLVPVFNSPDDVFRSKC